MEEKLYSVKVLMDKSINPDRDYKTVLEAVARKIPAKGLSYINFDSECAIYHLYLRNMTDFITLLREGIEISGIKIPVYPSYDAFLVSGVYPFIDNSTLCELFSRFGNVSRISNIRVLPDIPKFSHIKSGSVIIELIIPQREEKLCMPSIITAVMQDFSVLFTIKKLCYICKNLGHDTLKCPGLLTGNITTVKYSFLSNNEISSFDDFDFIFKEDTMLSDEVTLTVTNDEKSGSGIKQSDEGHQYLSVQPPGRLTASSSFALHSSNDMMLSDDKHYGRESWDNNNKLRNMNIYRVKKRKRSNSSPSANDQNSSEVSNVTCLNIGNEVNNANVSLNPKNCSSLSVCDDSGQQFKKYYSISYCARCKEELKLVGNKVDNKQYDSFAEIASNKVSENVVSEIHGKNSGLEAQSAENLSIVPLSINESYETQNQTSNVILDAISHLDDDIYIGKEENFPKSNNELKIHSVGDHVSLPENTHELKSSDVLSNKKVNQNFVENTDEFQSVNRLNVGQSKEEILSFQSSHSIQSSSNVIDARPFGCTNEIINYSAVINPTNDMSFLKPQSVNHASNIKVPEINHGDQLNNIDLIGKKENFPKSNKELKIIDVYSVGKDHTSLAENPNELKHSNEWGIEKIDESFIKNTDELESTNRFNIGQKKDKILSLQSSLSIQSSFNITGARLPGCTNEVIDYSAVINPTNDISLSKPHSVDHAYYINVPEINYGNQLNNIDLTAQSHQTQLSDNSRRDPLPGKNIDELYRYDSDQSSTCSSCSLPSLEELLNTSKKNE